MPDVVEFPILDQREAARARAEAGMRGAYGRLPLAFEPNRGQANAWVRFLVRGRGYSLLLDATRAVLSPLSAGPDITMRVVGADPGANVSGRRLLPGISNYLIGDDQSRWITKVPTYDGVFCWDLYPGVDLVYHGVEGKLEYDFVVAAGVDPTVIALAFEGADGLAVTSDGDLVVKTPTGELRQRRPVAYQQTEDGRREVSVAYACAGGRVGFEVGAYDRSQLLVIDPALVYSTYVGGGASVNAADEGGRGIAVDLDRNVYITGSTRSVTFPTTPGALQPADPDPTLTTAFVAKLNQDGSALVYSTYVGGSRNDSGNGIAVDRGGAAYITGSTGSADFPTTPGAFQPVKPNVVNSTGFVAKLNQDGSGLVYSTYLGGSVSEDSRGIAVDEDGNAYVTGDSISANFPTTPGAFQTADPSPEFFSGFVAKLNQDGSGLVYSTYLGGANHDGGLGIRVDRDGSAYVTGYAQSTNFPTTPGSLQPVHPGPGFSSPFVAKLNQDGSGLVYSTYLGGGGFTGARAISVDSEGSAYVTGNTSSADFPTTPGVFQPVLRGESDVFVTKLNPAGSALVYSTYLGGSGNDIGRGIAVDRGGNAHIVGNTFSTDFPTTADAVQPDDPDPGNSGVFVARLNRGGTALVFSTYLGGCGFESGEAVAVDASGNSYITGALSSVNYPTTPGAFQSTAPDPPNPFVTKLR